MSKILSEGEEWIAKGASLGARIAQARRLRALRESRDISPRDMAADLEVSHATYWRWERDQRRPGKPTLKTVARVLGCDVGLLLGDATPEATPEKEAVTEPAKVEAPKRANRPIRGKTGVHPPTPDAEKAERKA